ncbi:PTS system mannose/fructose/N-acetylgalactosamine-transporter subunit IIB [Thermosediminibacter oceani]|uniref:Protein-N(Pi)-phosphohistidine--sugarphosphotran sferase n=1 Tax=Thermosediminibacter oceani (strain ATCC BAA-1034 / DSM 16646 / JW/IW-1228P) TaxID=555079 RepID=D9S0R3_THEOJ|nr:PTS sugar transporter subunit IIB [Thermosediminibacter oceani]ADL07077.1 Protein-N(pi)-phosphohistidine--sugarphosphotran sferase [Thermosediminibacter oceani DSM 16646]
MSDIVLARIDDRLIHGQVITGWVRATKANRIIIVDDGVAQDPFMTKVMLMAAPPAIKVEVYNIQQAVDKLMSSETEQDRIIILVKTPKTIYELIKKGIDLKEVNVGGMGAGPGRKQMYKNISVSQEERNIFREIINLGVQVNIRIVPDDKSISIEKFL